MQELTIDGSLLEGGGQIVRLAVALSSIIRKPIKVVNIRSNRPNPGLKLQHLVAMKLATNITDAYTKNIYLGSEKILFSPKTINSGKYSVKSLLVIHAVALLFKDSSTYFAEFKNVISFSSALNKSIIFCILIVESSSE